MFGSNLRYCGKNSVRSVAIRAAACGVLAISIACAPDQSADDLGPLHVAAAASLREAAPALARGFAATGGSPIDYTFGATGMLERQIAEGAPYELFLSADEDSTRRLFERGLAVEAPLTFATGRLVIWQRGDAPHPIASFGELADAAIRRIAIANPAHAPYGIAAEQALRKAALYRIVRDRLVPANNIRQALRYAETGAVDVAIVAASLVPRDQTDATIRVPENLHAPIRHTVALLSRCRDPDRARRFVRFIRSDRAGAILKQFGLEPVAE